MFRSPLASSVKPRATVGLVLGALLLGPWLVGCPGSTTEKVQPVLTARILARSFPLSHDPHFRNEVVTLSVLRHVYEGLTDFGDLGRIQPLLAASWNNPDALTWRFRLREGVRFHDGTTLDTGDVLFSLARARDHPQTGYASLIVEIAEVKAIDDLTLEIRTRQPYPVLLNKLAFISIVPEGTPDEIERPIGTGPFHWLYAVDGEEVVLRRNDTYWRGPAVVERVVIETESDRGARQRRLLAAASGDADPGPNGGRPPHLVQDLDPAWLEEHADHFGGSSGVRIVQRDSSQVEYLALDPRRPPFDDVRVRRAIDLAIDREALVRDKLRGKGRALHQLTTPTTFGYNADLEPVPHDPDEARRLLAEAGHPDGLDLDVWFRTGRDFDVLRAQLAAVGLRVTPHTEAWADIYPRMNDGLVPFYLGGIVAISGDSSDILDSMLHSRDEERGYGKLNSVFYTNPEVDRWIEEAGSTLDPQARRKRIGQALRITRQDHVYLPLYSAFDLYGVAEDWTWDPQSGLVFDAYGLRPPSPGE